MSDTCTCGHVRDEHGGDQEHPGSTACTVTVYGVGADPDQTCPCLAFESCEEDEDG